MFFYRIIVFLFLIALQSVTPARREEMLRHVNPGPSFGEAAPSRLTAGSGCMPRGARGHLALCHRAAPEGYFPFSHSLEGGCAVHVWSLSLSHNYRVFIGGCFAVPVLGPRVSVMLKAVQTLSGAAPLRLAAGRSPGSESSGQSRQTHLRWRAVCSRRGLEVAMKWLRSPMNSPRGVILQCPGSPLHRSHPAASPDG